MTEHSYDDLFLRLFASSNKIRLQQNFEAGVVQSLFKLDFEVHDLMKFFGLGDVGACGCYGGGGRGGREQHVG